MVFSNIHCETCMCVGPSRVGMIGAACSRSNVDVSGVCCSGMVRVYICRNGGDLCTGSVAGRVFMSMVPASFLRRTVLSSVGFAKVSHGNCRCRTLIYVPRDPMYGLIGLAVDFSKGLGVATTGCGWASLARRLRVTGEMLERGNEGTLHLSSTQSKYHEASAIVVFSVSIPRISSSSSYIDVQAEVVLEDFPRFDQCQCLVGFFFRRVLSVLGVDLFFLVRGHRNGSVVIHAYDASSTIGVVFAIV